ncbi:OsmC family peroxiredoxin [Micropruina sp.]|uniref:OsmC family peroxiredoxin n=1 Tax=Micropruina sp. TaxID=2737536 RepID=UPI0039E6A4BC
MATNSTAQAHWEGSLIEGAGKVELVTSQLGEFELKWAKRAEASAGGTNPEELIAAAHASCYSMALSHALAGNGTPAESIDTTAVVGFQPGQGITGSDLTVKAKVPGLTADEFQKFADGAKTGCPVSAALAGIPITLSTEFVQ